MGHDIAHCKGINCPIKDDCFRYQAHMEVVNGKYTSMMISYFLDGSLCKKAEEALNNQSL